MDGDGDDDLVSRRRTTVSIKLNQGGVFGPDTIYWASALSTISMAVGDMNGDGFPDVVVGTNRDRQFTDANVVVLLNDGAGGLSAPTNFAFPTPSNEIPQHLALGDLNGNGSLDVSIASYSSNLLKVYFNDGAGALFLDPRLTRSDVALPQFKTWTGMAT